jgi:hypothetical protein
MIGRFDSRQGLGIYLFTTASRLSLGPTQLSIQWVSGTISTGVKRSRREADHSHPPSATVKNAWIYTSTPQYDFMAWYLVKHSDNFTFTFNKIWMGKKHLIDEHCMSLCWGIALNYDLFLYRGLGGCVVGNKNDRNYDAYFPFSYK